MLLGDFVSIHHPSVHLPSPSAPFWLSVSPTPARTTSRLRGLSSLHSPITLSKCLLRSHLLRRRRLATRTHHWLRPVACRALFGDKTPQSHGRSPASRASPACGWSARRRPRRARLHPPVFRGGRHAKLIPYRRRASTQAGEGLARLPRKPGSSRHRKIPTPRQSHTPSWRNWPEQYCFWVAACS